MNEKLELMRKYAKKAWHYIWHNDSFGSLIVNLLLAIILVKFVIYPGLSFALGTTHPVVAVISQSMHHGKNFDSWYTDQQTVFYQKYNISKEEFKTYTLHNGFSRGDLIAVKGASHENLEIGDVIVFWTTQQYPIIHRIIEITEVDGEYIYHTKGDNNPESIQIYLDILGNRVPKGTPNAIAYFDETDISEDMIVGKAMFKIPYVGLIKIWVVEGFQKLVSIIN